MHAPGSDTVSHCGLLRPVWICKEWLLKRRCARPASVAPRSSETASAVGAKMLPTSVHRKLGPQGNHDQRGTFGRQFDHEGSDLINGLIPLKGPEVSEQLRGAGNCRR